MCAASGLRSERFTSAPHSSHSSRSAMSPAHAPQNEWPHGHSRYGTGIGRKQTGHERSTATLWSACSVRRWQRRSVASCLTSVLCACCNRTCFQSAACSISSGVGLRGSSASAFAAASSASSAAPPPPPPPPTSRRLDMSEAAPLTWPTTIADVTAFERPPSSSISSRSALAVSELRRCHLRLMYSSVAVPPPSPMAAPPPSSMALRHWSHSSRRGPASLAISWQRSCAAAAASSPPAAAFSRGCSAASSFGASSSTCLLMARCSTPSVRASSSALRSRSSAAARGSRSALSEWTSPSCFSTALSCWRVSSSSASASRSRTAHLRRSSASSALICRSSSCSDAISPSSATGTSSALVARSSSSRSCATRRSSPSRTACSSARRSAASAFCFRAACSSCTAMPPSTCDSSVSRCSAMSRLCCDTDTMSEPCGLVCIGRGGRVPSGKASTTCSRGTAAASVGAALRAEAARRGPETVPTTGLAVAGRCGTAILLFFSG